MTWCNTVGAELMGTICTHFIREYCAWVVTTTTTFCRPKCETFWWISLLRSAHRLQHHHHSEAISWTRPADLAPLMAPIINDEPILGGSYPVDTITLETASLLAWALSSESNHRASVTTHVRDRDLLSDGVGMNYRYKVLAAPVATTGGGGGHLGHEVYEICVHEPFWSRSCTSSQSVIIIYHIAAYVHGAPSFVYENLGSGYPNYRAPVDISRHSGALLIPRGNTLPPDLLASSTTSHENLSLFATRACD